MDGDVDLNASPEALDKLLGYVLAFKVKVQSKFRNVVVLKYSSDLSLINTMMDLLPDAEVLLCKVYFRGYWDSHILHLCSFVRVALLLLYISCRHFPRSIFQSLIPMILPNMNL